MDKFIGDKKQAKLLWKIWKQNYTLLRKVIEDLEGYFETQEQKRKFIMHICSLIQDPRNYTEKFPANTAVRFRQWILNEDTTQFTVWPDQADSSSKHTKSEITKVPVKEKQLPHTTNSSTAETTLVPLARKTGYLYFLIFAFDRITHKSSALIWFILPITK